MTIKLSLFRICLFTALLLLPAAVQAQQSQFSFTTNNGAITITGYIGLGGSPTIPDTINGFPVTSIAAYAFNNSAILTGITISTNVTSIGDYACNGCNNLTSLALGNATTSSLTSIGAYAFNNCSKLNSNLTIPNNVTNIGAYAFNNCYKLPFLSLGNPTSSSLLTTIGAGAFDNCLIMDSGSAVSIPSTVTSIGDYAFSGCNNLGGLSLGSVSSSSLKNIGNYAFDGCFSLNSSLTIPNNVTNIGAYAFNNCYKLPGITLGGPTSSSLLTTIGAGAFDNCLIMDSGSSLTIPNTVTSIGDYAFNGCNNLGGLSLGSVSSSSLKNIGNYAFDGCFSLNSSLTIPNNVTNIGAYAFNNCYKLSGITLGSPTSSSLLTTIGAGAFDNCLIMDSGGSLTIPNTVTSIGDYAFSGCNNLGGLSLGSGLKSIGNYAFDGCFSLNSSLTIPNNVTNIGAYAFNNCYKLSSIMLGNPTSSSLLTTIGAGTFDNCLIMDSGSSLAIPNTVTSIGDYAFSGCNSLGGLSLGSSASSSSLKNIGNYAFDGCFSLNSSLTIPNSVTNIGAYAFNNCYKLSGITLGSPTSSSLLTTIGAGAFDNCLNMDSGSSLTIPNTVTSIGDYAFGGCNNLGGLSLGSGLKNIGAYAFDGCYSLNSSLTIPNSVTNIGTGTFNNCIGLPSFSSSSGNAYVSSSGVLFNHNQSTLIQYPAGNTASTYTIPSGVTNIADGAFNQCDNLINVTIPSSVTNIGEGAFAACIKLIAISVAVSNPDFSSTNGVLFDKNQAKLIQYPAGLFGDYTVPISVTSLGDFAFDGCSGLGGIYFQGNAPALGINVFTNVNVAATVYYLSGMTGWGATYGGLPAVMLVPAPPTISINNVSVQNNDFGFTVTGPSNQVIVVDANTNLASTNWQAIQTNTLTDTPFNFNDSQWTNNSQRFYRISLPQ